MLNEAESRAKWEIQFDYWFGCIKSPGRLTLTTATSVKRWRWKPDCDGHSVSEKRSSEKWSRRCRHKAPNMFIKRTKMWGRNWIGALGQANLLFFVDLGLKRLGFFKWRKGALTWKEEQEYLPCLQLGPVQEKTITHWEGYGGDVVSSGNWELLLPHAAEGNVERRGWECRRFC